MDLQKAMLADHYGKLGRSEKEGVKNAYTFVPGNLTELLLSFDILPVLPEINALQNAMRKKSRGTSRRRRRHGALRGCLHVREVPISAWPARATSDPRGSGCPIRPCCCSPTPAASPS